MARPMLALLAVALIAVGCASSTEVVEQSSDEFTAEEQTVELTPDVDNSPAATSTDGKPSPWVLRNPVVDHDATVIDILVSEQGCASGLRADDRIGYDLTQSQSEIIVTALITPLEGDQECPGNPLTPLSITLGEPIGDRELVDGSGEIVDAYIDFTAPPVPVAALSTAPLLPSITPATTVTAGDGFYIEPRCEVAEDSFEDRFASGTTPEGVFAQPEHVIAALVAGFDLSEDGWHLVENTDDFGQLHQSWTQYLDGVPKAAVLASPAMRGWRPQLVSVCDLGGPWTPDAQPPSDREVAPLAEPASELADVNTALEQVSSLSFDGADWRFPSEQQRCATWIQVENALEQTGHIIRTRYVAETNGESETFQLRLSVVNEAGEVALLTTSGPDQISVDLLPLPQRSTGQQLLRHSFLSPCWLDTPVPLESE